MRKDQERPSEEFKHTWQMAPSPEELCLALYLEQEDERDKKF